MDENELIQAARKGDTDAFRSLFDMHSGRVFSLAYRYLRNQADDVLQESFVRAFRFLHTYDPGRNLSFTAWIGRICVNCSIDALRRGRRQGADPLEGDVLNALMANAPHEDPERTARSREIRESIDRAIDNLSPRQRMIFILHHHLGHTTREIADVTGSKEGSVKKHLFRAVDALKKRLRHFALEEGYEL
jgi:RNA polymerase sigma-70 factor (ECF subfamily)